MQQDIHRTDGTQTIHLAFGHQRLSILDLSVRSSQPFRIDQDVLLYNGEIYNFHELATELSRQGYSFTTGGDTEILFKSVLADGERALERFNGMWAFSMYRGHQQRVFLSRDRYGKKPLFYYLDANVFCVSSTILAIQIYLQQPLHMREDVLVRYLIYGDLYPSATSETHFRQVSQLLPGHHGTFDLATWKIDPRPYFAFHDEEASRSAGKDPELLVELLKDSVRKRLISDRPVGLLLSGGVDSTLILSTLFSLGLQEQCRIYMGDTGRSDDYQYAKRCAEQLGVRAETVVLDYDHNTFERFLQVCRHQEKPIPLSGSAMAMPQMYEVISSHGVPVVLDGTGGDEIFGGYWQRQFPHAIRTAVRQGNWQWLRQELGCKGSEYAVKANLLRSCLPAAFIETQLNTGRKLKALTHPFFKPGYRAIMNASPSDPMLKAFPDFTRAMCADTAPGGRLGEWLWHNDRNSMMSSVEGRSPLLDHRINPFIYTSYDKKFVPCWNKFELRSAFDALTPLPTQWRREKQGFRWDGRHFLSSNQHRILELIRENECLADVVDIPKLVRSARKQPKLLKSAFCKKLLVISGVERAFSGNL